MEYANKMRFTKIEKFEYNRRLNMSNVLCAKKIIFQEAQKIRV